MWWLYIEHSNNKKKKYVGGFEAVKISVGVSKIRVICLALDV